MKKIQTFLRKEKDKRVKDRGQRKTIAQKKIYYASYPSNLSASESGNQQNEITIAKK